MTARTMRGRLDSMETKAIDIVIPVYNEERDLVPSVRRLHSYLETRFPFPATITMVDNASTDATWPIAEYLTGELPNVRAIHLDAKGRGRALRTAWLGSQASIVAYMDVDLSTDLDALLPLATRRATRVRPQRHRDREPAGARRACSALTEARAHLSHVPHSS